MSAFNTHQDSPDQIKAEGRTVALTVVRKDGKAIISWNIPDSRDGVSSTYRAYNGIVLTASTTPATIKDQPVDGVQYVSDETFNTSLHAGDKIGNSYVIGTFYNDVTTLSLEVSDFPLTPVYITAYPVSAQLKYYSDGVHAYEQDLKYDEKDLFKATHGFNLYAINGAKISDPVDYVNGTVPAQLNIKVDVDGKSYTLTVPTYGINNYRDLIDALNFQLIKLKNPSIGDVPLNTGGYWVDIPNRVVYQWDGSKNVIVKSYFSATNPHTLPTGYKWFDPSTNQLKEWDGSAWDVLPVVVVDHSPSEIATYDLWFDGTDAYFWNGTTWIKVDTYYQENDPSLAPNVDGLYWFNTNNNTLYFISNNTLYPTNATLSDYDPTQPPTGSVWLDITHAKVYEWDGTQWVEKTLYIGNDCSTTPTGYDYYYDISNETLTNLTTNTIVTQYIISDTDPTDQPEGSLWWNTSTDELFIRHNNAWVQVPFEISAVSPIQAPKLKPNSVWIKPSNNEVRIWEGNTWKLTTAIFSPTDPYGNTYVWWFDTSTGKLYNKISSVWTEVPVDTSATDPSIPMLYEAWFNTTTNVLSIWNGMVYIPVGYNTTGYTPSTGSQWYNPTTGILYEWNGSSWVVGTPLATVSWAKGLLLTSNTYGSSSHACWIKDSDISLLEGTLEPPLDGMDSVSSTPMMYQQGIGGNDGSNEERLMMVDNIRRRLGHPTVVVELTDDQINAAIDRALRVIRTNTSAAYHRRVGFMQMKARTNNYIMSNKKAGYDKIVDFMKIYRLNSSFMSVIGNDQIYGQLILQQLYQAGSFDLVSYHLIAQQIELLQKLFAGHVQFNWYERTRELTVYNMFAKDEIVLIDVIMERTENELFVDRFLQNWIERYALAESREVLADIRGKFSTLPGASGGISLNASDLLQKASEEKELCMKEIEEFIIEQPENFDGVAFIMG